MEITAKAFRVLAESVGARLGLSDPPATPLSEALRVLFAQHGWQILLDPQKLEAALVEQGGSPADAARLHLFALTPGFEEWMRGDDRTAQADLARVIQNAAEATHLSHPAILALAGDIAWAADLAVRVDAPEPLQQALAGAAYVVPLACYRETLEAFEGRIAAWKADASAEFDLSPLEPLAAMGLPKAQYYVGFCLLHGVGGHEDSEKGLELLHQAAEAGDAGAAAALGDHYFRRGRAGDWSRAYRFYTGYGAAALSGQRRLALTSIFDQKRFNQRFFAACAALVLLSALVVIGAPGAALYAPCRGFGWFCVLLQAAVLTFALLRHRRHPHGFHYPVPVILFALFALYSAARLLL